MHRILAVILAALAFLSLAIPAGAGPHDEASRAYLVGQLGDAFAAHAGLTDVEVLALAATLPDPGWSDDEGDVDGDGVENGRDELVAAYARIAHAAGVLVGKTPSTFAFDEPILRQQAATVFKRIFFGFAHTPRNTQYSDVSAANTDHSCNIHVISDIDQDGLYGDSPFIVQGYPPVPSLFKPLEGITESQVDLMVARAVAYAQGGPTYERRDCSPRTPPIPRDVDTPAMELFTD